MQDDQPAPLSAILEAAGLVRGEDDPGSRRKRVPSATRADPDQVSGVDENYGDAKGGIAPGLALSPRMERPMRSVTLPREDR